MAVETQTGTEKVWTPDETETLARLLEAADADAAHWTAGDWLLARDPMGDGPWPRNGSRASLAALADVLGRPLGFLLALRQTARAWPPETRPACASWQVCRAFTLGGAERAYERREQIEALPRGPRGRVTMPTLVAWRRETERSSPASATERDADTEMLPPARDDDAASAPPSAQAAATEASVVAALAPRRRRKPALPRGLAPALVDLCDRTRQLVDDADRLRRAGELPPDLSVQLDALHGAATSVSMVLWSYTSR